VTPPPLLIAFDLMHRDGKDLCAKPLRERRAWFEDVAAGSGLVFPVRRLAADGLEAWQQVLDRDCEGYVAKRDASPTIRAGE
jgi:ATP-dependent DNA ligase